MTNFYQTFQLAGLDVADLSTKFIDHFMKTSEDTFMKQIGWNILTAVWKTALPYNHSQLPCCVKLTTPIT